MTQNLTESPAEAEAKKGRKENLEAGQKSPEQKTPGRKTKPRPSTAVKIPGAGPGVGFTMDAAAFVSRLAALGYNISTAHRLLGMGRSTIYRMSKGTAKVPGVVARLIEMYEQHGIPEEHRS